MQFSVETDHFYPGTASVKLEDLASTFGRKPAHLKLGSSKSLMIELSTYSTTFGERTWVERVQVTGGVQCELPVGGRAPSTTVTTWAVACPMKQGEARPKSLTVKLKNAKAKDCSVKRSRDKLACELGGGLTPELAADDDLELTVDWAPRRGVVHVVRFGDGERVICKWRRSRDDKKKTVLDCPGLQKAAYQLLTTSKVQWIRWRVDGDPTKKTWKRTQTREQLARDGIRLGAPKPRIAQLELGLRASFISLFTASIPNRPEEATFVFDASARLGGALYIHGAPGLSLTLHGEFGLATSPRLRTEYDSQTAVHGGDYKLGYVGAIAPGVRYRPQGKALGCFADIGLTQRFAHNPLSRSARRRRPVGGRVTLGVLLATRPAVKKAPKEDREAFKMSIGGALWWWQLSEARVFRGAGESARRAFHAWAVGAVLGVDWGIRCCGS